MNKPDLMLRLELLEKQTEGLIDRGGFMSFLKATLPKEKQLLLKKLQRKAEELLNSLKNIEFSFKYYSFNDPIILEYVDTLQSNLNNIIRFGNLRIPTFIAFLLVKNQISLFQDALSKVIIYVENNMN